MSKKDQLFDDYLKDIFFCIRCDLDNNFSYNSNKWTNKSTNSIFSDLVRNKHEFITLNIIVVLFESCFK